MDESRFIELELRYMQQADLLQQLSDVLYAQQQAMETLRAEVDLLKRKLEGEPGLVDAMAMAVAPTRRTYKWYTGEPVFEFGHGLHYTNFTLTFDAALAAELPTAFNTADLIAQESDALYKDLLPFVSIPVTVTNDGAVASDFVVLAFMRGEYGPQPYPNKSLVGFTRVHDVEPGQSVSASMDIDIGTVARSDEKGDLVLFPGSYSIVLDVDDRDVWEFVIEGEEQVLDSWPARE